jgi:hypothetical protein
MTNAMHAQAFEQSLESGPLGENEWEFEGAFEGEGEWEAHEMHEAHPEQEAEQFFGNLAKLAARAIQSPALRRVGMRAARSALSSIGDLIGEGEGEAHELHEGEGEINPIRKVYPDAMMEHMAHMASMAETEQEAAEQFLPLIPMVAAKLAPLAAKVAIKAGSKLLPKAAGMAARVAPRVLSNVMRVAPTLTRGIGNVTRTLHRNPQTRQLVRVIPTIARRATAQVARAAARGQVVTPGAARQILARQTVRTLCRAGDCVRAYRRGRTLDRRLHRAYGGARPPGWVPGRAGRAVAGPGYRAGYPYRWPVRRRGVGYGRAPGVPGAYPQGAGGGGPVATGGAAPARYGNAPGSAPGYPPAPAGSPGGYGQVHRCQCNCHCPTCGR